jgi:hypothetical protein
MKYGPAYERLAAHHAVAGRCAEGHGGRTRSHGAGSDGRHDWRGYSRVAMCRRALTRSSNR